MWKNKLMNNLKNQKGFMSIEAVLVMGSILMVVLLGIGFFTYLAPKQAIEEEVHVLGRIAKMQGGLSNQNIDDFRKNMVDRGMVTDAKKTDVVVKVLIEDGKGAQQGEFIPDVTPAIQRGDKNGDGSFKIMKIIVKVPAKKAGLNGVSTFFGGANGLSDYYVFSERVMSEYYKVGGI